MLQIARFHSFYGWGLFHCVYGSVKQSSFQWQPTPVLLPEKSHEQRSLAGYSPWGHRVRHALATEQWHMCIPHLLYPFICWWTGCISHFQGLKRHMWLMVTMWADVAREDGGEQAKGIRGPWEHRESCRVHSSETRTPGRFWTGQVLDLIQDYFGCCAKINGEEAGSYLEMH